MASVLWWEQIEVSRDINVNRLKTIKCKIQSVDSSFSRRHSINIICGEKHHWYRTWEIYVREVSFHGFIHRHHLFIWCCGQVVPLLGILYVGWLDYVRHGHWRLFEGLVVFISYQWFHSVIGGSTPIMIGDPDLREEHLQARSVETSQLEARNWECTIKRKFIHTDALNMMMKWLTVRVRYECSVACQSRNSYPGIASLLLITYEWWRTNIICSSWFILGGSLDRWHNDVCQWTASSKASIAKCPGVAHA